MPTTIMVEPVQTILIPGFFAICKTGEFLRLVPDQLELVFRLFNIEEVRELIENPGRRLHRAPLIDGQSDRRIRMFHRLGEHFFLRRVERKVRHKVCDRKFQIETRQPPAPFATPDRRS